MEEKIKKKVILVLTVVFGIVLVTVLGFVYQQLVKVYGKIDKTDSYGAIVFDEYVTEIENTVVSGLEIVQALTKYKSQKNIINVSYNFSKGGYYEIIYTNSNWDIAINNFNSNMTRYTDCLLKKYFVTFSQTSGSGKYLLTFSCQ